MQLVDLIKLFIVLMVFPVGGILLGSWLRTRMKWQYAVFAAMCFMTINGILGPGNWGMTVCSVEFYRGHTKGFHHYYNQALALALIFAIPQKQGMFRALFPPGMLVYFLYWFCSCFCIFAAPNKQYVFMAAHKMAITSLVFYAAFRFLNSESRLRFFMRTMAFTLLWETFAVLKCKYLDGQYQVKGTFEHQNSLVMYSNMIGMVFLAVAMSEKSRTSRLCLWAFFGCAIITQSTLSRAGMAFFVMGAGATAGMAFLEKPNLRRAMLIGGFMLAGMLGLLIALDTIIARFNDHGNTASAEYREVLNAASRQMVQDHPFGIGWNNYALAINEPHPYAEFVWEWMRGRGHKVDPDRKNSTVESHYYLLMAENGYLGYGLYMFMISLALYKNVRAFFYFPSGMTRLVSLGICVGCGLNYVQSMLERVLTQPRNLMLWFLLYAVTSKLEKIRREKDADTFLNPPDDPSR